ncbi:MAG: hypothetical protein LBE36_09900 [Flavobacteriaceae bacterium]|jgi:hypothetical protein|nr:hypothetical protein [Flavobacteriaceae bacterium]
MVKEKKLTSIRLSKKLYVHLQKQAEKQNRSINNYIETLLYENSDYYEPNEETIEAMNEVQEMIKNGTGKAYNNVNELIKDLTDE